jgi:uncharacterized protein (TIGR02466 family)
MRKEYQKLHFFPVESYEFHADKSLLDDTLSRVKDLEYKSFNEPAGVMTTGNIHDLEEFAPLMSWFQECVDTIHFDNGLNCDRLVVNKAWSNRSLAQTGHRHDAHRHPMSYYSGIFYLTQGAPTIFLDPLWQRDWSSFYIDGHATSNNGVLFYHGGPGGLILFPSWMVHASAENTDDVDRYSIAFNTFPNGDVNRGGWQKPMVNLEVSGWKKLGPLNLSDYARD